MIHKESLPTPSYHVQTTAETLRNAFPYFHHHDSISALWHSKWKTPCAHGIYPFTDGKLEDFEAIFQNLIQLSGDRSEFLYQPDEYAKPFLPVGANLQSLAADAEAKGNLEEARQLYLRAAAVYRIARFPINRSKVGQEAWERGKVAYSKGGRLLSPPNIAIDIPFTRADEGSGDTKVPIQAYLRIPVSESPEKGWPVLLFICGLDAYRTDHTPRTQTHVDRGFATISFEIPGTGDCPAAPNDPASSDRLMSSIFDWLDATAEQHGFDLAKVVARGISTGGYNAMRVAHTHAERLFAVVAQGGGCHHMFDPQWIAASDQMEYPFALSEALAYKFGYRSGDSVDSYIADGHKFSLLTSGILDRPSCKLLVLDGTEDSIFPIEDNVLVALRGGNKDLIARGNRPHMGNPGAENILYDWIADALAGKP